MVQKDKAADGEPSPSLVSVSVSVSVSGGGGGGGDACAAAAEEEAVVAASVAAEEEEEEQQQRILRLEPSGHRKFISGVVEGSRNGVWIHTFMRLKMTTNTECSGESCTLWKKQEHGIEFIYAISPGLDITFSNQKEVSTLKRKLDQVTHFGCKSFALLFDDIDHNMCPADKEVFSSFAHAQVSLTNEIFQYLGEPETFLFCPTGPKVVSKDISVESIEEVSRILRRAPVIWDNIHANDYDQKRLFLGPYKGRSTELIPRLNGVLTNPNCEFESNFVAIHTLATWYKSNMNGVRKDVVMTDGEDSTVSIQIKLENEGSDEELETDMLYSPQLALKLALTEWLGEFGVPHQYNSRQVPHSGPKSTVIDVASLGVPSMCSATTVTTMFQQPIMSPAVPPLCPDPHAHPMVKRLEEVSPRPSPPPLFVGFLSGRF
ncbi:hypothetical protein CRUP_012067 [Coryphaenoides rupestris]|nr:hypothetical protein CRUP_012067 [Coryphaenoides rupestris]